MGAKKPKKPRQPKVVTRDLKAEEAAAAAAAAEKANIDAAYRRKAKARMMTMKVGGSGGMRSSGVSPSRPMASPGNKKTGA